MNAREATLREKVREKEREGGTARWRERGRERGVRDVKGGGREKSEQTRGREREGGRE